MALYFKYKNAEKIIISSQKLPEIVVAMEEEEQQAIEIVKMNATLQYSDKFPN